MSSKKSRIVKSVGRNYDEDGNEVRRGPWALAEDNLLIQHINSRGEGQWNFLAKSAGLKRTGKSCRLRWLNYLKPDTKRGNLTPHEQLVILELHSRWGNRWSKIAQHLPGRTDNEIKNYWRTRVQKQARQLKVDSNSDKFLDAVRLYWMPRLREKMEQNTASTTSSPSSSVAAPPSLQINGPVISNVSGSLGIQEVSEFFTSFDRDGCYHVDYGMGCGEVSTTDCHMADIDWIGEEVEGSLWNS